MPGSVDQVEHIRPSVGRRVVEPNRLRLDGDAPFPFQIHGVEDLVSHIPLGDRSGRL